LIFPASGENKIAVPMSIAQIKVIHPQGTPRLCCRAFTPSKMFGVSLIGSDLSGLIATHQIQIAAI
jgi:hypothetical protein